MITFEIPLKESVQDSSRKYFDYFTHQLGSMPNLYAMLAHSGNALEAYFQLHNREQSLDLMEKEVVALVVASVNASSYCIGTHTMIGSLNGMSRPEIEDLKKGEAPFNEKLDALAKLTWSIVVSRGRPEEELMNNFFSSGYTSEHLVDLILAIGENTIANILCLTMKVPDDRQDHLF